eukprot:5203855-Pleurochrysis_carterae.AAC.3
MAHEGERVAQGWFQCHTRMLMARVARQVRVEQYAKVGKSTEGSAQGKKEAEVGASGGGDDGRGGCV